MTHEEALVQVGEQTAEAVADVLRAFVGDGLELSGSAIVPRGMSPLGTLPAPAIVSNVSYVDGATGGNVFAISIAGARNLAAAMMGAPVEDDEAADLSELEMSAVGEAANQMLAAAAATISKALGQEIEIDPPETRRIETVEEALDGVAPAQWMTTVSFSVEGEPCRLVQLIPHTFVVRMTQALEQQAEEIPLTEDLPPLDHGDVSWLRGTMLRVSGEIGRARLPAGRVVQLGDGSIVPLDRGATDPVDLYLNGTPFARGRLVLVDDEDWAVRIEELVPTTAAATD